MAFVCPQCARNSLEIELTLELPADDTWDEISFQLAACRQCGLRAAARYQESRRGNLQDETWLHTATAIDPLLYQQCAAQVRTCPAPHQRGCTCAAHQALDVNAIFPAGTATFALVWAATGSD